jgi:delta-aminolevulinic acid dehydratase/porphobilinogen synthase
LQVYKARDVGVNSVVLFPKVPDALKTSSGEEAFNPDGLVPRCIRLLKDKFPDLVSYTNICEDRNVAHLIDHCAHLCILTMFWWVSHIGQLRACVMVYCEHFAGYLH